MQTITLLFIFTVQKHIYPPVGKVHAGSFRVSVSHRTLQDMDYRIFNVRTWSLFCVRIHTGVGHTHSEEEEDEEEQEQEEEEQKEQEEQEQEENEQ